MSTTMSVEVNSEVGRPRAASKRDKGIIRRPSVAATDCDRATPASNCSFDFAFGLGTVGVVCLCLISGPKAR